MEIGAPLMEIGGSITRENVQLGAALAFGSVHGFRFFDRVAVYLYDASRQAFPGTARIGSR
jgi:hypothetical protein